MSAGVAKWISYSISVQTGDLRIRNPLVDKRFVQSLRENQRRLIWARTPVQQDAGDLRIKSPSGHPPESRARQRSQPKRPVIFSAGLPIFVLSKFSAPSRYYR
jgi:hypothetical protein